MSYRASLCLILLFVCFASLVNGQSKTTSSITIRITAPSNNTSVHERPTIEGKVSDPNAKVMVVVHPTDTSAYWVQPNVTVQEDGTWKVKVYIGQPNADTGKLFEIMAFANPVDQLKEGDKLSDWPQAQAKSQVIELKRK